MLRNTWNTLVRPLGNHKGAGENGGSPGKPVATTVQRTVDTSCNPVGVYLFLPEIHQDIGRYMYKKVYNNINHKSKKLPTTQVSFSRRLFNFFSGPGLFHFPGNSTYLPEGLWKSKL